MTQLCSIVIIIQGRLQDQYLEDVFYVKLDLMEANKKIGPKKWNSGKVVPRSSSVKVKFRFCLVKIST